MKQELTTQEQSTIAIVEKQLEAYNARDIEAFIATYHDDIEIFDMTEGLLYSGKAALKERYGQRFDSVKYLNASSLKRIVHGRFLVDHELAESASESLAMIDRSIKLIVTYEILNDLIKRVTFIY